MEWILDGIPPVIRGAKFQVWLDNGNVRECRRIDTLDPYSLFFSDCVDKISNAYCDYSIIRGWRLKPADAEIVRQ